MGSLICCFNYEDDYFDDQPNVPCAVLGFSVSTGNIEWPLDDRGELERVLR
jgi:hypothetical protein